MNAPVPSEISPVYPVTILSPIAARLNTRKGIITVERKKFEPKTGMMTAAVNRITPRPIRSWRIGNTAISAE